MLLQTTTVETDGISSQITIVQDSTPITVHMKHSGIHIQDDDARLTVYVPHEKVAREVCFGSELPERLARWMATDAVTKTDETLLYQFMLKLITSVMGTESGAAMDRILDLQGIIKVPVRVPEEENSDGHEPTTQAESQLLTPSSSKTSESDGSTLSLVPSLKSSTENALVIRIRPSNNNLASVSEYRRLLE